jgi:predicted alpha/beta-hydrolase family hydrolase
MKRKRANPKTPTKNPNATPEGADIVGGLKDPTGNTRSTGSPTKDTPSTTHFKIPFNDKQIVCQRHQGLTSYRKRELSSSKTTAEISLVFTHGAGGGIENPATKDFVRGFATKASDDAVCFQGTMNLAHRVKTFHAVLGYHRQGRVKALGGRSMGARAAVIAATECEEGRRPEAVVLVSYPLSSEKKTKGKGKGKDGSGDVDVDVDPRRQILLDLPEDVDVLFVSGSKDSMCDLDALHEVRKDMKARSWVIEVQGADHGMSLTPKSGVQPLRSKTGSLAAEWLESRDEQAGYASVEWSEEDVEAFFSGWAAQELDQNASSKKKRKK